MHTPENFTALKEATEKKSPEEKAPGGAATTVFEIFETRVASACGLSRDRIAELRKAHLTQDVDWAYVCKRVLYTAAGAAKVRAAISLPPVETTPPPETAEQPEPVTLAVWRTFPQGNTRIIEAYVPGTNPEERSNIVRVRVRSSEHYVPGMNIPAVPSEEGEGLFTCARPDPRWKGTW